MKFPIEQIPVKRSSSTLFVISIFKIAGINHALILKYKKNTWLTGAFLLKTFIVKNFLNIKKYPFKGGFNKEKHIITHQINLSVLKKVMKDGRSSTNKIIDT